MNEQETKAAAEAEAIRNEKAQDEQYKSKYGVISKSEDTDEQGNKHVIYFRKPSRTAVGLFMVTNRDNATEACEILLEDSVVREISDYEYFKKNDAAFLGLMPLLIGNVGIKKNIYTIL